MPKTKTTTPISKRCDCSPRRWNECSHPWHFEWFFSKTKHLYPNKGKHRYSLDVLAQIRGIDPPRSKDAAQSLADALKIEIRAGVFRSPRGLAAAPTTDPSSLTVSDVIAQYLVRHVQQPSRRPSAQKEMQWALDVIARTLIPGAHGQQIPFGAKPMRDIVRADIEAWRTSRRTAHAHLTTPTAGAVALNRMLGRLRHLCSWAVIEGFLEHTPFRRGGVAIVKLTTEQPRYRRLVDGEEAKLLAAAGRHLHDLIVAALSTACRQGELLNLKFKDITPNQTLVIRAEHAKTNERREVPVGQRLAAVVEMRKTAPDGQAHGPDAYIFGNPVGEKVGSIKKSWMVCVLKSHGHLPVWVKGTTNHLAPASRAAYRSIGLHFHDLRRECASRWLEAGVPLHVVRDLLGHKNISQTSTYLKSTATSLASAMALVERHQQQLAEMQAQREQQAQAQQSADAFLPPSSERIQ